MIAKYCIIDGFLGEQASRELLDMAIARESSFEHSMLGYHGRGMVRPDHRSSFAMTEPWKDHKRVFRAAVTAQLPRIFAETGATKFEHAGFEIQFVVTRESGRLGRHIDTFVRVPSHGSARAVSAVYYMHRRPKAFHGGELVLYDLVGDGKVAIEPFHDRLIAFSSILPHEVLATTVPGDAFADARFSINCWIHKPWEQLRGHET